MRISLNFIFGKKLKHKLHHTKMLLNINFYWHMEWRLNYFISGIKFGVADTEAIQEKIVNNGN